MSRLVCVSIMTILVGGWHLWSPVRVGLFRFQVLVVRGWMVGEKKKAEEYSAAKGLLRVSTRLGLQVLVLVLLLPEKSSRDVIVRHDSGTGCANCLVGT